MIVEVHLCDRCGEEPEPDTSIKPRPDVGDASREYCDKCDFAMRVDACFEKGAWVGEMRDHADYLETHGVLSGAGGGVRLIPDQAEHCDREVWIGDLVVVMDAECEPIALVPRDKAYVIAEILNRAAKEQWK